MTALTAFDDAHGITAQTQSIHPMHKGRSVPHNDCKPCTQRDTNEKRALHWSNITTHHTQGCHFDKPCAVRGKRIHWRVGTPGRRFVGHRRCTMQKQRMQARQDDGGMHLASDFVHARIGRRVAAGG